MTTHHRKRQGRNGRAYEEAKAAAGGGARRTRRHARRKRQQAMRDKQQAGAGDVHGGGGGARVATRGPPRRAAWQPRHSRRAHGSQQGRAEAIRDHGRWETTGGDQARRGQRATHAASGGSHGRRDRRPNRSACAVTSKRPGSRHAGRRQTPAAARGCRGEAPPAWRKAQARWREASQPADGPTASRRWRSPPPAAP